MAGERTSHALQSGVAKDGVYLVFPSRASAVLKTATEERHRPQRLFKRCSVDAHPQTNQRMIEIDQLLQVHLKQLTLRLFLLSSDAWFFPS